MFSQIVIFSSAELLTAAPVAKEITFPELTKEQTGSDRIAKYRTTSVKVTNGTGGSLDFYVFTEEEYTQWLIDPTLSDGIPVADSAEEIVNNILGQSKYIVVTGSVGNTLDLGVVVMKQP